MASWKIVRRHAAAVAADAVLPIGSKYMTLTVYPA